MSLPHDNDTRELSIGHRFKNILAFISLQPPFSQYFSFIFLSILCPNFHNDLTDCALAT